jgi:hypothetical protein
MILVAALLTLCGCGMYRAAEQSQPVDIPFRGPLRPVSLTPAQIKIVQAGVRDTLTDPAAAEFGSSYRAGISADGSVAVCGFVNGKRFVGIFAKQVGGTTEFLLIRVVANEGAEDDTRRYCRVNGIYLPKL